MAERKIIRGVRHETTTYVPDMETELAKVLSPEEVKRLTEKGYLEGGWGGPSTASAAASTASTAPAKDTPKPTGAKEK